MDLPTADIAAYLDELAQQLLDDGLCSPADTVSVRRDAVVEQLAAGDEVVTVKPPSGREVDLPADVARHLLCVVDTCDGARW